MGRVVGFLYGVVCYGVFFATFLYAIGFVGGIAVPKTIDSGAESSMGTALLINLALLGLFAVQHSVMARPGFKAQWTRIVPKSVERSTYVLLTSLALILLYWQWRPLPEAVWMVENSSVRLLLQALFWLGWGIVLLATFMINHFDLFGLRQVYFLLRGQEIPSIQFKEPGLYRYLRHPIMLGFIIAFWATPDMTQGHLLFAVVTTAYILVAIQIEERTLVALHGDDYRKYQKLVSQIIPMPPKSASQPPSQPAPTV